MIWMTNKPSVRVVLSPQFLDAIKRLKKKYRRVRSDIQPLLDQLEQGETPGDRIKDVGFTVYKARVRNRDVSRGKSGGYRVIYYLRMSDMIVLLTIYSKAEKIDISGAEIRRIISDWESSI
jgi:mRNA-degrading endonuclease RelE of RelBE toxin-antitoxin system